MSVPYTIIIGLEVHVQLLTESKMFCACSTKFGAPPNTQTCPVCIGMPGSLPVMNRRAVELALRTAVALNCQIAALHQVGPQELLLSRPAQGLPDQPVRPAAEPRRLAGDQRSQGAHRAEADRHHSRRTWKRTPARACTTRLAGKADSRIDLNRCGVPLLEIVSQPDMRSPAEAKAYLTELKLLLNYLEVSDCNMQEGSLRVDANINLHIDTPQGKRGHADRRSEEHEQLPGRGAGVGLRGPAAIRQSGSETGQVLGEVPKTTRGWDEASQTTRPQRSKEESSDYRYFPDPDLVPVTTTAEQVEQIRAVAGRVARRRPRAPGANLRHHALRQRRAGEPGPRAGRLLRRVGRALRRRQGGQQLGAAGRAADAQRAAHRHRRSFPCGRRRWPK